MPLQDFGILDFELHFQDRDIDIIKWDLVNNSEEFDDSH